MGSIEQPKKSRTVRDSDIDNLRSLFTGTETRVITPEHNEYAAAIARWSMAASKPAGVVVEPANAQDVGKVVKYAADHGIDLSVRGGGHSTAGASSTDGGIMLWLQKLRNVSVEDRGGEKVFRIGGGANWGDVDDEGVKHGLHTVGGTVADTGVGGLTLGGGYGWLSGKHGLSVDCLVEIEMALASGEIVRANEHTNSDLFWAVGGAGQNFGVATEFISRAYPQGDVWCGMVLFDSSRETIEKLVAVVNDMYTPDSEGRTKERGRTTGGLGFASPPPAQGAIMTFVCIIYHGTEEEGQAAWKALLDLGPAMSTMSMKPFPEANKFLAPPYGLRCSMKGSSFQMPLAPSFVQDVREMYAEFMQADMEERGLTMIMYEFFDPHKTLQSNRGCFANRGVHMNALICPIWKNVEHDATCRQWARVVNERFTKELEKKGVETSDGGAAGGVAPRGKKNAVMLYGNYDQYDERSKDLFGDNYPRLQVIKAKYDPQNVFNKLFPITADATAV